VPEELDGAGLAVKAPGELLKDLVHPRQHVVVAPDVSCIARAVVGIGVQGVLVVEGEGFNVYGGVYPQRPEPIEEPPVELRDGQVIQGEGERTALASRHGQPVRQQVEGDVEGRATVGYGASSKPSGGDVERDVSPVVPVRRVLHSYLAHYLAVAVQGLLGGLPLFERERWKRWYFVRRSHLSLFS
jgi:hypothetical protein